MIQNITDLSRKLRAGKIKSITLVEQAFAAIDDAKEEGEKTFLRLYRKEAANQAKWIDDGRAHGIELPRFAGIPIAIKDLFDVRGEVTRAGSKVLDENAPADQDADIVKHLRSAGFVIIGKNNMTEFAYSGLGVNAHFGTPRNPFDNFVKRIPGGSSSGAAVCVSAGMVAAAIGTDTGGSCRIPAAFCGIVGFKPTSNHVSKNGVVPLSKTLDSVGSFATSVSCSATLYSVLSGGPGEDVDSFPEGGIRIGVLEGFVDEKLDESVATAFQEVLTRLSHRGVRLAPLNIPQLSQLPEINKKGGLVGADAYAWHRHLLDTRSEYYDPWVLARIKAAKSQTAADYIALIEARQKLRATFDEKQSVFDALILPTVQIVPPTMEELHDPAHANATNLLCIRNTSIGNFLDLPAISIPCHKEGSLPVGAMLFGRSGEDKKLLSIARGLEHIIRGR